MWQELQHTLFYLSTLDLSRILEKTDLWLRLELAKCDEVLASQLTSCELLAVSCGLRKVNLTCLSLISFCVYTMEIILFT